MDREQGKRMSVAFAWYLVRLENILTRPTDARGHGMAPFVVYQGCWSASVRDFEREIIPMCETEGMGIAPWGSLGRGNYKSEAERERTKGEGRQMGGPSEVDLKVSKALEGIAKRKNTLITSIVSSNLIPRKICPNELLKLLQALAYVMHKTPYVFPIVGGRKVDHLKGNIEALSIELSKADIDEIEKSYEFDPGFPLSFLFRGTPWDVSLTGQDIFLTKITTRIDTVAKPTVRYPTHPICEFPSANQHPASQATPQVSVPVMSQSTRCVHDEDERFFESEQNKVFPQLQVCISGLLL